MFRMRAIKVRKVVFSDEAASVVSGMYSYYIIFEASLYLEVITGHLYTMQTAR